MTKTKVWKKEEILMLLMRNDKGLFRGIVAIYKQQTIDEQEIGETNHHNGRGYNGIDAELMTSFAKQILNRGFLSFKQKEIAKRKMKKYAGQLTKIANGKL